MKTTEETIAAVREALTLQPCHVSGMHDPNHHTEYTCNLQRAEMLKRVLVALELTEEDLPHELHGGDCCRRVPLAEQYRELVRQSYVWAGVEIPAELAAPAPDVPQEGDAELVYGVLAETYETWQEVLPRLPSMPLLRYGKAIDRLWVEGRVETLGIQVRRKSGAIR